MAHGRPINIANPTLNSVTPNPISSFSPATLTVTGFGLDTVSTVSFGAETPTPGLISPTSSSISPIVAIAGQPNVLTIAGTGFFAGTTVQVGSQSLFPSAISATELTVTMAAEPMGPLTVTVTHPNFLTADRAYQVSGPDARIVFLTSTTLNGGFSSVSAADVICQSQATFASLPGTYRAWLSESLASPSTQSPATTFPANVGPYVRVDGVIVADDWSDLTDGSIQAPILVTAGGDTVSTAPFVWTGTNTDGTARSVASETCQEWSTNVATGVRGIATSTTFSWTFSSISGLPVLADCNSSGRLYCFQQ